MSDETSFAESLAADSHAYTLEHAMARITKLERELAEAKEQANHWKAQCHRGFNVAEIIAQRDALLDVLRVIRGDGGEASPVNLFEAQEIAQEAISKFTIAKGGGQ